MRLWFAAMLILVVPSAQVAGQSPARDVVEWTAHIYDANSVTDWDGDTVVVNITRPHTWTVVESRFDILLSMNVGVDGANAIRFFHMAIDGTGLGFCSTGISTSGAIAAAHSDSRFSYCPTTNSAGANLFLLDTSQTWSFTTNAQGTVPYLSASVHIRVQDIVEGDLTTMTSFETLTGLTGTEFGTIIGLAVALIAVAAFSKSPALNVFAGTLAVLLGVLLLFFTSSAIVVVLAVFLGLAGSAQLLITFLQALPGKKPRQFFE